MRNYAWLISSVLLSNVSFLEQQFHFEIPFSRNLEYVPENESLKKIWKNLISSFCGELNMWGGLNVYWWIKSVMSAFNFLIIHTRLYMLYKTPQESNQRMDDMMDVFAIFWRLIRSFFLFLNESLPNLVDLISARDQEFILAVKQKDLLCFR